MKTLGEILSKLQRVTLCMLIIAPTMALAQEKMPVTTYSTRAKMLFVEGRDHFEKFHFTEASQSLKESLSYDKSFPLANLYLYLIKDNQGKEDSEEYLKKAVRFSENTTKGENHLIGLFHNIKEENEKEAKNNVESLIKIHPRDERVLLFTGWFYYVNQDMKKATTYLKRATQLNNKYHPAFNLLGYSQMNQNKMSEAESSFKRYLELLPYNANAHDSYAEFLKTKGEFDEAEKHYRQALNINPNMTSSYKGLADIYLFKGNFALAKENYAIYASKNNNINDQFNGLLYEASIAVHENNIDKALEIMDKYQAKAEEKNLPVHKTYSEAYKGYILSEAGRTEEGIQHYRNAKSIIEKTDLPEQIKRNLVTRANIWEFYALVSDKDKDAADKAQKKCEKMLTDSDNTINWNMYHNAMGLMELNNGNYSEARKHFNKSSVDSPQKLYYTGLSWEKEGDLKKARKYYEKVSNYYNNSIELSGIRNKAIAGLKD